MRSNRFIGITDKGHDSPAAARSPMQGAVRFQDDQWRGRRLFDVQQGNQLAVSFDAESDDGVLL